VDRGGCHRAQAAEAGQAFGHCGRGGLRRRCRLPRSLRKSGRTGSKHAVRSSGTRASEPPALATQRRSVLMRVAGGSPAWPFANL
jgi:hypothetical protein